MPLPLALVFHFTQHTQEYADIANRACYRGLLNVLRAHPGLKFNLHLSGTLLRALPWFDMQTLELVKDGLADGQFELLGSTYAQNMAYASDDWDNAQQIGLHRLVLSSMFGVEPTVYWNAGRSWRQSLVPVIVDGGFTVTLVEDHILHAAGLVDPEPAATVFEGQSLTVVYDDSILRDRLNYAAWFGRRAQLFEYLRRVAERPGADQYLLAYAEDAEAMGLWGLEKGFLPQATWAHLDALLGEIERAGPHRLALRHLSSARPLQTFTTLPDGAGLALDRVLHQAEGPSPEDGYLDWFDFIRRWPEMAYFRRLYAMLRARLQALGSARSDPGFPRPAATPGDRFYRQAVEVMCHHQYGFGGPGVGGRSYWGWENVRAAFMFARAVELADDPRPMQWVEDVNGDGSDEQILCDGRRLAVLTAYGGRLVYWFDLAEGRQWVGNQLAVPPAPFTSGSTHQPKVAPGPRLWLPESFTADLRPWKSRRTKERTPTRMGRHLPPWVFEREPAALTVYRRVMRLRGQRHPLRSQTGAFADTMTIDGEAGGPPDDLLDYRFEPGGICYLLNPMPDVVIEKHVRQNQGELVVRYVMENRDEVQHRLCLQTSHEMSPDYAEAQGRGRAAYSEYHDADGNPGVVNNITGNALVLKPRRTWVGEAYSANLLALEVQLAFQLDLAPRSVDTLDITLGVIRG